MRNQFRKHVVLREKVQDHTDRFIPPEFPGRSISQNRNNDRHIFSNEENKGSYEGLYCVGSGGIECGSFISDSVWWQFGSEPDEYGHVAVSYPRRPGRPACCGCELPARSAALRE